MAEDTYHLGIKALLRNTEGQILLLQLHPSKTRGSQEKQWDIPGGRIKQGESVHETLRREVAEETGLQDIKINNHLGIVLTTIRIPVSTSQEVGLLLSMYECSSENTNDITLSSEHVDYRWFSPQKTMDLLKGKYSEEFCSLISRLQD